MECCALNNIDVHFVKQNITWNKNISSDHKKLIQDALNAAEHYSNEISDRIKNAIKLRRKKGHYIGQASFGWKIIREDNIRKRIIDKNETNIKKNIIIMYSKYLNKTKRTKKNKIIKISKTEIFKLMYEEFKNNNVKRTNGKEITKYTIESIIKQQEKNNISNKNISNEPMVLDNMFPLGEQLASLSINDMNFNNIHNNMNNNNYYNSNNNNNNLIDMNNENYQINEKFKKKTEQTKNNFTSFIKSLLPF